jgi:ubiquinone/menaquinone biosynthesis C-methylase UbiE
VEPVKQFREVGYRYGITKKELIDDALELQFKDGEFYLVCGFGVLHHIRMAEIAISEMLRVAKKSVFISNANNFLKGSLIAKSIKQIINLFGLWKVADLLKTKGKGYTK